MAKKPKPEATAPAVPEQKPWLFQPGQSGNPAGRVKGSRNKLSEDFVAVLYDDFTANGKTAIEACRANSPETYVKVIAGLLPKEMHIREAPLEDMSDDDIRDALARIAALRTALLGGDGAEAAGRSKPEGQSKPH
jgi:hypothetical protein